ncbi:hypothetical protein CSOJ01_12956 [Colletotrichum sojae]|uniref:Uncharacterized protein n=1 Tax=Colletotrichum sojae TaxID=2175907 RepID=A0A8H6ITL1_9PEZI|nr:hypothetical protein CSOJ01_12956 [Colletotrichum sojae]
MLSSVDASDLTCGMLRRDGEAATRTSGGWTLQRREGAKGLHVSPQKQKGNNCKQGRSQSGFLPNPTICEHMAKCARRGTVPCRAVPVAVSVPYNSCNGAATKGLWWRTKTGRVLSGTPPSASSAETGLTPVVMTGPGARQT